MATEIPCRQQTRGSRYDASAGHKAAVQHGMQWICSPRKPKLSYPIMTEMLKAEGIDWRGWGPSPAEGPQAALHAV